MKTRFFLLAAICLTFFLSACEGGSDTDKTGEDQGEVAAFENKKRDAPPLLLSVTRYKTSPEDTVGSLLSKENYNENGLRAEYISYDYYGSNQEDGRTKFEYNEKGELIKDHDGTTTTTYKYDEKGKKIEDTWSRAGGQGEKKTYTFDEKGNELEEKHFKADGTYDFSRVTTYKYDEAGNILTEQKWEKYSDGTTDLMMFHITREFNDRGLPVKKSNLRDDGSVYNFSTYKYDGGGNLIEETEYDDGSKTPTSTTRNKYNPYGEIVFDEVLNCGPADCDSPQFTNEYRYNAFGKTVFMMYRHSDGDAWGERTVYEYRK